MKFKFQNLFVLFLIFFLAFLLISCSVIVNSIMRGVEKGVSQAVEKKVEAAVYTRLAPRTSIPQPATAQWDRFMALQAQIVFSYTFSPGGYWVGRTGFKPGEYVKYEMSDEDESRVIIEKAFLKELDDGKQWWRISWISDDGTWIYEALLSPTEEKIVRLRARDPNGNEGEVPITDEVVYVPPAKVTDESIKGATVGKEIIKTPVGEFECDHVVFMSTTSEGRIEWWINNSIPGGVVKYMLMDDEGKTVWSSVLKEYGKDASSVLGSY